MLIKTMEEAVILVGICLLMGVHSAPTTQFPQEEVSPTEKALPDLGYLAVAPKVLVAGTMESVCIHLLKYNSREPVELSVVLMTDNVTEIHAAPLYLMEKQQACVKLQVPDVAVDTEVILRVQAKRRFAPQVEFEVIDDKRVHIRTFQSDTFIQTDKPIYKPGQTVYFRLMTLDQELRPDTSAFSEIWIEAPSGIRLAQWKEQESEDGLIDLEMPMTSEPPLGDWKIVAIQNGKKTEQTFKVDEYVLPKFEIIVTTPPYVLIDEEGFDVEICGRYTYGQPVEGSFSGTISVQTGGYEYRPRPVVGIENQDTGKSGCGTISVNASDLNLKSSDHSLWKAFINVDVDFTETNTGFVLSESTQGGIVTSNPLKINILAPETFKPGVPFFGEIEVKYPDGSAAGDKFIQFTVRDNEEEILEQNFTSPANGIIAFEVPDIDINANSLEIYAWAPGYDEGSFNFGLYSIYDPSTTFYAKPRFSPSGSFIQMSPIRGLVDVDSEQTIDIYYTSNQEDVADLFSFIVMSRGNILDVPLTDSGKKNRTRRESEPFTETEHIGQCPPVGDIGGLTSVNCTKGCTSDLDCEISKTKCCDADCDGGSKTCVPLIIVNPFVAHPIIIRQGDCPIVDYGLDASCDFQCMHDGDCFFGEKCCTNGCGTQCFDAIKGPCPDACPFIYSPVCGSDGRTHRSRCVMEKNACEKNIDISFVHEGECLRTQPPRGAAATTETVSEATMIDATRTDNMSTAPSCPQQCSFNFDPVCASNGLTYPNECSFRREECVDPQLEFAHHGPCIKKVCSEVCTFDFAPVCGTDNQTYVNLCDLERSACMNHNKHLTVAHDGECKKDSMPTDDPLIGRVGECPPVFEGDALANVCTDQCFVDTECNITQRCCPTDCGGSACMELIQILPPEEFCPELCPLYHNPVCGTDGKTYSNQCELRYTACVDGVPDLYFDYPGECLPDVDIAEPGQLRKIQRTITVTADMSPIVRVLAYYIRPDGEVVADTMSFKVLPTFNNKVEIEFEEEEAKPGSETRLRVSAAPYSLCALGIVDKSVHVLGGDNSVTKNKVFSALDKYQLSDAGGQLEWSTHCPNSSPWWWRGVEFKRRKRTIILPSKGVQYDDASHAFQDMGLVYLTNLDVETRPCTTPFVGYYSGFEDDDFDIPVAVPLLAVDDTKDSNLEPIVEPSESGGLAHLRTYFPETWLWNLERTGPTGDLTVNLDVPHTITEWVSNGFCTSFEAGVGVSETSLLKAFQPFFVSLTLPYSVIRGESVPIKATIFNYLEECLVIEATLAEDSRIPLKDAAYSIQQVCVCGGDSAPMTFQVVPNELGNIPIRVDAMSVADTRLLCGNEVIANDIRATDAIEKELLVEAEGVEQDSSYSNYVCPTDYFKGMYSEIVPLMLPLGYVNGSEIAKVQVTGDIMGPSLNNLENLVQRPYGCGEQNMLGFVPNIFVMRYLNSTDQLTPEIATRTKTNMQIGYQRELNYRRDDGSYSAFGNSDPEGSTWLTAFVMWSFAQANEYINIDQNDLAISLEWLKQQQNPDTGCFNAVGLVHHKAMKGGVNNGVTLSAYVLMALLEGGVPSEDDAVANALNCLHNAVDTLSDTYTAAQMAYALALAGSDRLDDVIDILNSMAIEDDGLTYWESNRDDIPSEYSYGSQMPLQSQNVEMTAYALLAYVAKLGRQALTEGNGVVRWIIQKRNPNGGFSSTQDTIVALQALSDYAKLAYQGGITMTINAKVRRPIGIPETQFYITDANRLLQQEVEIPVPGSLALRGQGTGCALIQVVTKYNIIPEPPKRPPFSLKTAITDISNPEKHMPCFLYSIHTCTSYSGPDGESNMALVQIKLVSGFYPEKRSLDILKEFGPASFRRVEYEKKTVTLYFNKLTEEQVCVSINVFRDIYVDDPKPGVISVTDYYEKDMTVSKVYELTCTSEFEINPPLPFSSVGRSVPINLEALRDPLAPPLVDKDENRPLLKVEVTEPSKVEVTEPPKVEVTEPPKVEITEPPKVEITEPPKVEVIEPPKVEVTEPPKVEVTEPLKVEVTKPPKVEVTEPPKVEVTEPPKLEVTEPPNVEVTEPPKGVEHGKPEPTEPEPTESSRNVDPQESKAGECPVVERPSGLYACRNLCDDDTTCPGTQKCCFTGCGLSCTEPAQTEPATFEPTESVKFNPTKSVKFVPTESAKFVPTESAKFVPTESAKFVPTEPAKFEPTKPVKFEPTEPPKKVTTPFKKEPTVSQVLTETAGTEVEPEVAPTLPVQIGPKGRGLEKDGCTDLDGRGRQFSENWDHPFDPCSYCNCNKEAGITCSLLYCDIPVCGPGFEIDYSNEDACCPGCRLIKPGVCPIGNEDVVGTCDNECDEDTPCSGTQKCCSNGCGKICVEPEPCMQNCTGESAPFCSTEGTTFSNMCELNKAGCLRGKPIKVAYLGPCEETVYGCDVERVCTDVYTPVCGTDGKTYSSYCHLMVKECDSQDNELRFKSFGECTPIEPVRPGKCPVLVEGAVGSCVENCDSDSSCPVGHKCCYNGCGYDCTAVDILAPLFWEKPCSRIYQPLCGTDGTTYDNQCLLEIAMCQNPELQLASERPCDGSPPISATVKPMAANCTDGCTEEYTEPPKVVCPEICTLEYAPVCGSNGKTYTNQCQLEIAQCADLSIKLSSRGPCQEVVEPRKTVCPEICTFEYAPVCGSNGKTYSNQCQLEIAQCTDSAIQVDHTGKCVEPSPASQGAGVCEEDPDICGTNAICMNSEGAYTCQCIDGYEANDQGNCEDQNECMFVGDICEFNKKCVNLEGTYSCVCADGFELNVGADTCLDIDECLGDNVCGDNSLCTNVYGTFECSCMEGYTRMADACIDEDECTILPGICGEGYVCTNHPGTYACECAPGYELDTQNNCVVSCPVCTDDRPPSGWLDNYCEADFVYVTKVRNDDQFRLLVSMSAADGELAVNNRIYVKPEWDSRCQCDVITGGARLMLIGFSKNLREEIVGDRNTKVLYLDSNSYVAPTTNVRSSIKRAQSNC